MFFPKLLKIKDFSLQKGGVVGPITTMKFDLIMYDFIIYMKILWFLSSVTLLKFGNSQCYGEGMSRVNLSISKWTLNSIFTFYFLCSEVLRDCS